jgi:tRNA (adenine22-N1)-methyltransferase
MSQSFYLSAFAVNDDSLVACAQNQVHGSYFGPMIKLSNRMQHIFDRLLPGQPVWDLCCDHGYLGLQAYRSGLFTQVFLVDKVPEIISELEHRFYSNYLKDGQSAQVKFIALPGEDLVDEIQGNLVIAGVGAHTILKILMNLRKKGLLSAKQVILLPQRQEQWLEDIISASETFGDYNLFEKHELLERGRLRKVLIFRRN